MKQIRIHLSALTVFAAATATAILPVTARAAATNGPIAVSVNAPSDPHGLKCAKYPPIVSTRPGHTTGTILVRHGVDPVWTPDGTRLAYQCAGVSYTAATNGSAPVRTALVGRNETIVAWAPDDATVLTIQAASGSAGLWELNLTTGARIRLTTDVDTSRAESFVGGATWSPDGTAIVYSLGSVRFNQRGVSTQDSASLWAVNPDGTDPRLLLASKNRLHADHPEFSPDGTAVAFDREPKIGANSAIWVLSLTGKTLTELPHTAAVDDAAPSWAPQGTAITFDRSSAHALGSVCVDTFATSAVVCSSPKVVVTDPIWEPIPSPINSPIVG